jgi:hypothetical protein
MVKRNSAIKQTFMKLCSDVSLCLIGYNNRVHHCEAKFRYQTNIHEIVQRCSLCLIGDNYRVHHGEAKFRYHANTYNDPL